MIKEKDLNEQIESYANIVDSNKKEILKDIRLLFQNMKNISEKSLLKQLAKIDKLLDLPNQEYKKLIRQSITILIIIEEISIPYFIEEVKI